MKLTITKANLLFNNDNSSLATNDDIDFVKSAIVNTENYIKASPYKD